MADNLLIVESPAKAHTIQNLLGNGWLVIASKGHIRDLPTHELGIDINKGYRPHYVILEDKKKTVHWIISCAEKARRIYLATDPDREGEAIAWHIREILVQKVKAKPIYRVRFNAITQDAVLNAVRAPGDIAEPAVQAQFARRAIDRLVGYIISERAQQTFERKSLSAGRVQSVALRLIVEREREIEQFEPTPYWVFTAMFEHPKSGAQFAARLVGLEGQQRPNNDAAAEALVKQLRTYRYFVDKRTEKNVFKPPPPPFTTSTMQQSAARVLSLSPEHCMQAAQRLYEGIPVQGKPIGLITYMRTDSVRVAPEAQMRARKWISEHYGQTYLPPRPPVYRNKDQAQDAHEAIRPTDPYRSPDILSTEASWQYPLPALYQLIWQRFIGSQMAPAKFHLVDLRIVGMPVQSSPSPRAIFSARGRTLIFDGFLAVYPHAKTEQRAEREEKGDDDDEPPFVDNLPNVQPEEALRLLDIRVEKKWTKPPPRYTEASLIKALEQHGIGRPSTYAVITNKLKTKKYVVLKGKVLIPTALGISLTDYLVQRYGDFFNVHYTAALETELDRIEQAQENAINVIDKTFKKLRSMLEQEDAT